MSDILLKNGVNIGSAVPRENNPTEKNRLFNNYLRWIKRDFPTFGGERGIMKSLYKMNSVLLVNCLKQPTKRK